MITGKTRSGFEFEIEDEALDDYEMLEKLSEIDKGNTQYVTDVVEMLLGKEQKDALKDHLRNERGRVTAHAMTETITDIFTGCSQGKNS
jgi:hypothetical protein